MRPKTGSIPATSYRCPWRNGSPGQTHSDHRIHRIVSLKAITLPARGQCLPLLILITSADPIDTGQAPYSRPCRRAATDPTTTEAKVDEELALRVRPARRRRPWGWFFPERLDRLARLCQARSIRLKSMVSLSCTRPRKSWFGRIEDFDSSDVQTWTFWTFARRADRVLRQAGKLVMRQVQRYRAFM